MVRASLFVVALMFAVSSCRRLKPIPNERVPLKRLDEKPIASTTAPEGIELDCLDVQFYLATRSHPNGTLKACAGQNKPIFAGKLDVTKTTVILVHGWRNRRDTEFTQTLKKAYLKAEDVNVIEVDWSEDADTDYFTAIYRVPQVGVTLTQFVTQMVEELKLDVNQLYLVGHSLGAHVVGVAGYNMVPKVARVIGLDPAGPFFEDEGPSRKLTKESGKFVMTLHTCALRLGTYENLGHLNFYANSGLFQPGCDENILGFCSHNRAFEYLAASLEFPEGFKALKCGSYIAYELGLCDSRPSTYFKSDADENAMGIYYFETSASPPYTTPFKVHKLDWTKMHSIWEKEMSSSTTRKEFFGTPEGVRHD